MGGLASKSFDKPDETRSFDNGQVEVVPVGELSPAVVGSARDGERVDHLLADGRDHPGRIAVNEVLIANPAVAAIIREGATQKLQDVIISGRAQGMQFMDDAIFALLQEGIVSPHEAFMKAIDKNRFKDFLPPDEAHLGDAAGAVDERERPSQRSKRIAGRTGPPPQKAVY